MDVYLCVITLCFLASGPHKAASFDCDKLPIPKSYVVYHLGQGEAIEVDGVLDEEAWSAVTSTAKFIDIQGEDFPKPRFETWVKMRWDDEFLYFGAYLEETDVFANQTEHDSVIFKDNDFEVFIDPDGSTHWYKEFEINAINTVWDLELNKPYLNGGSANNSFEMPTMQSAVYVDGPVNDPLIKNKYWTVEIAMPFTDLIRDTSKATAPPKNRDQWRINFSRVQWHVHNVDGHYEKIPGLPEDNWVWSSQDAINMHLPERWGILQFSSEEVNSSRYIRDPNWAVYSSLVEVYNAEKKFFAIQGYFTAELNQLELSDWVVQCLCAHKPNITVVKTYNFNAAVAPLDVKLLEGHVQDDRLIWFTDMTDDVTDCQPFASSTSSPKPMVGLLSYLLCIFLGC